MNNISYYNINRNMLRKVMVKIELERINIQERVIMKKLLNSVWLWVQSLLESRYLS